MGFRINQNRVSIAAAMAGSLLLAIGSAHGGDDPLLLLESDIDGDIISSSLSPTSSNGNLFTYEQELNGSNYEINWSMYVNDDLNSGIVDGYQSLNFSQFDEMMCACAIIAGAVERQLGSLS